MRRIKLVLAGLAVMVATFIAASGPAMAQEYYTPYNYNYDYTPYNYNYNSYNPYNYDYSHYNYDYNNHDNYGYNHYNYDYDYDNYGR